MTGFVMVLGMLLGGVLQAVLPTAAWLGGIRPPILLSLTLYYALTRDRIPVGAALTAGLIQDALGMLPLGYSSLCFCGAAWLANRFRDAVFAGEWFTHAVFGALLAGVCTGALYVMLKVTAAPEPFHIPLARVAFKITASLILGAVCAPLVCGGMERLERALGFREMRHA